MKTEYVLTDGLACFRRLSVSLCRNVRRARWLLLAPVIGLLNPAAQLLAQNVYFEHKLVSDIPGMADMTDTNLVNPWGIALSGGSPFWVSDNHAGVSTLYNGIGAPQSLVVTIPPPSGGTPPGAPTGVIFNGTTNFPVVPGAAARFIFATEDGTIAGWTNGATAVIKVDNSTSGAVYKGLASGTSGGATYLYAADFHNGKIDVFDTSYSPASLGGSFTDPTLPSGFAPFGIANVGGQLFVTYAVQDPLKHDDVAGPGNGIVSVFDTSGNFVTRFATSNVLNSPWGIAKASPNFGQFSGALLIGNFGNGKINAFDPGTGNYLGTLQDPTGSPISIEGLWGLVFGNGGSGGDKDTLYFAAGISGGGSVEDHGLFGSVSAVAPVFTNMTDKGIAEAISWVGGTGPFLLQKKVDLNSPAWVNVMTTTNRNIILAKESDSGFCRVQGLSGETVLPFTVYMDGASEEPTTGSPATAIGALSLEGTNLTYYISFSGLSGPATAAHIHAPATPTNTANPLIFLSPPSASSGVMSGTVGLTPDQVTNIINGLCYANIHTSLNPAGEIRGQIVPLHMVVSLNGASEVPPVAPAGTASGSLTFIGSQMFYTITYSGLTSGANAAHIHGPADTTQGGNVLIPLATPSGTNGTISGTVSFTPQNLAYLLAGKTYINIHTANNPLGEIRGQIWPIQFEANMNAVSEVPSAASPGTGAGLMNIISNTLSYSFTFTNLLSAATLGHIHGPAGTTNNAGVLIPFTVPNATAGSFSGTSVLNSAQLLDIISGLTYANIHTTNYPAGEIRGQVIPHN